MKRRQHSSPRGQAGMSAAVCWAIVAQVVGLVPATGTTSSFDQSIIKSGKNNDISRSMMLRAISIGLMARNIENGRRLPVRIRALSAAQAMATSAPIVSHGEHGSIA